MNEKGDLTIDKAEISKIKAVFKNSHRKLQAYMILLASSKLSSNISFESSTTPSETRKGGILAISFLGGL